MCLSPGPGVVSSHRNASGKHAARAGQATHPAAYGDHHVIVRTHTRLRVHSFTRATKETKQKKKKKRKTTQDVCVRIKGWLVSSGLSEKIPYLSEDPTQHLVHLTIFPCPDFTDLLCCCSI